MDDPLDRFRRQIEEEREQAARERAAREALREREQRYDAAWRDVINECGRQARDRGTAPHLQPYEHLIATLRQWDRVAWLDEIRANFIDQLDRGYDTPDRSRRPEVWLLDALLSLAAEPPNRERASQLLSELPQITGAWPGEIADNVRIYVRDHQEAMRETEAARSAEQLERARPLVIELAKRKAALRRDLTFLLWEEQGSRPPRIRDRWNDENSSEQIGSGTPGREVVKKGLQRARRFMSELRERGVELATEAVLILLPRDE